MTNTLEQAICSHTAHKMHSLKRSYSIILNKTHTFTKWHTFIKKNKTHTSRATWTHLIFMPHKNTLKEAQILRGHQWSNSLAHSTNYQREHIHASTNDTNTQHTWRQLTSGGAGGVQAKIACNIFTDPLLRETGIQDVCRASRNLKDPSLLPRGIKQKEELSSRSK